MSPSGMSPSVTAVPRMVTAAFAVPGGPVPAVPPDAVPPDAVLAAELADAAGQLLLEVRREHAAGADPALKALGDRAAQELLAGRLEQARPLDPVLSEEAADDLRRLASDRVWIVDPLDGTREYSEGRHDWAVHVALWEHGALAVAAVALPGVGEVLTTHPPARVPERADGPLRMAVSRTRPPALADELSRRLGLEPVPMGSAGYKAAAVVRG